MSKITKALTALMVIFSMLLPMAVVDVYADDTHYTYNSETGVHTWDFIGLINDPELKDNEENTYNETSFQSGTAYSYHDLIITGGGSTSKLEAATGMKCYNDGASISYTPTHNGVLTVNIKADSTGAVVRTGTAKNSTDKAIIENTTAGETYSGEIYIEADTTYYVHTTTAKAFHITEISFDENAEKPSAHYTYKDGVHTWTISGLQIDEDLKDSENGEYSDANFQSGKVYLYKGLKLYGNGTVSKLENSGMKCYANNGTIDGVIEYTPEKDGKLTVKINTDANGATVRVGGKKDGTDETVINSAQTAENPHEGTISLEAGTTYYIYTYINKALHITELVYDENVPAPAATYTIKGTITTEGSVTSVSLVGEKNYNGVISGTSVTFTGVEAGSYTVNVTPASDYKGAVSDPASITVSDNDNNAFTITSTAYATPVITFSGGENGTFKVMNGDSEVISGTPVKEGTSLTVTATPNDNYKLKTMTYQEADGEAVDISSTKTFTVGEKAITVTAEFEAEASEPEPHYSYDSLTKTHTWNFIGLDSELKNGQDKYSAAYFQNGGEYVYEGLTLKGDGSTKFTSEGLQSSNKVAGYVKYTPSKNGTLTITAVLESNAELYVSAGSQDKGGDTNANKLTPVSANAFTKELTANTDYYIFNGSSRKMVISELKFAESDEKVKESTPKITIDTDNTKLTGFESGSSYTINNVAVSPSNGELAIDDAWYGTTISIVKKSSGEDNLDSDPQSLSIPAKGEPVPVTSDHYKYENGVHTWTITELQKDAELKAEDNSAYDTAKFRSGTVYMYKGLKLSGNGSVSQLEDLGMKTYYQNNTIDGVIEYTPEHDGELTVKVRVNADKATVRVGKRKDGTDTAVISDALIADTPHTGKLYLTAGETYYIYTTASKVFYIQEIVFDENVIPPEEPEIPGAPRDTFDETDNDKLAVANSSDGGVYEYSTNTKYPADITSARSGVRTVASGLNVAKNSQHLAFEMTLNTLLKENTTSSGAPDTFALEFTSGTGKVGGMLVVKTQTKVDGKDAMLLDWRTGSWQNRLTKPLVVGEKYTFDFTVNTTKDGDTETLDNIDLSVYDKDGNLYDYASELNRRNAASVQIIYLMAQPRTVGESDSVTIENVRTFYYKPESTLLEITKGKGKEKLNKDTAYSITADKFNDTEWVFKKPYSLLSDGSTASYMTTSIELKSADGLSLPQNISFDESSRTIKAASGLAAGDYNLTATVVSSYNGKELLREDYPITLTRPVVTPQEVMTDYSPVVEYNGSELTADTAVTDNITIPTSNAVVSLKWNSYNSGIVSNTGAVTRPLDDTDVTLEVQIASVEDPTKTKTETITVKVKGVRLMLEDAIARAKAGITSVDDGRAMDADALNDLHEDIKFITKYKNSEYTGYEKVSYSWKSDSEYLKTSEETAEIWPTAIQKYSANLTLTAKYENQKIDEVIPVTINLTKENAADKYAVRADGVSPENFRGVEEYVGTTVSDDISLPTEGIFGSTISWTSSAPAYMSNTGKYKMPSNNTNVTLSAIISKGNVMSDSGKTFKMTLKGKSNSQSSGGSGGGGGSSSSGKTSTFTTAGTTSAPLYTPPSNEPDTQDGVMEPSGRFDDLGSVAWAEEAINALAEKGIISGRGDREFAPNDDITRAEFATIIVNAFDLYDEAAECDELSDVAGDAWYYRYIASAYNNGIISGYDDGRFGVEDKITRQDMAVIIYRTMNSLGIELAEIEETISFSDGDLISDYAKEAVTALQKADIVNGVGEDEFAPLATATRAQAAVIIYNTQK